jgi:asparagine synthase (glutamine-hydrolysing)
MCGICGEIGFNREPVGAFLDECSDQLGHRGPDERSTWRGSHSGLGITRLSIIDLAGGSQPIFNEDRSMCIVYNGELYNFQDIRPELEAHGHVFRTRSDTEVVLHAYEQWGAGCLRRFNGMFAFAIWDSSERALFLARDRIGEKPLYYYVDGERLVFASEIKAIVANPLVPRRVCPRGLVNYLAFGHAVAPDTMYEGILKLLPGHYLIARNGTIDVRQYWDVGDEPFFDETTAPTEQEYAASLMALLEDSVRRRMVADVPVGAFLSGGVDSSAVVALMQRQRSAPVRTFALGFGTGGAYDERADAAEVAHALGTQHHELHVDHLALVDSLKTLVFHYDEPFGDAAGFPVLLLSRFAREHVKVVLTGDGGDELFGGYRRYAADQAAESYSRLPTFMKDQVIPGLVGRLPRARRLKKATDALRVTDPARRYAAWLSVCSADMRRELLSADVLEAAAAHDPAWPYPHYYQSLNGRSAGDHVNRLMYVDVKTWLADDYMEKIDKATMAASLEARIPFLDHRLVELAFQIPGSMKIRGWSTKRILKRAVAGVVPGAVLRRPKHGFSVPTDPWFRGELKEFAYEVLLDRGSIHHGYFNRNAIERLWEEHGTGRNVWDTHLWLLLNFELWHHTFINGSAA